MSDLPQMHASESRPSRLRVAGLFLLTACSDRVIVDASDPLDAFDRDDVALVCNNQCELSFCGGGYRDFEVCYDDCVQQEGLDAACWRVRFEWYVCEMEFGCDAKNIRGNDGYQCHPELDAWREVSSECFFGDDG